jgi:glycosyltransferase involved in cell wall biosynthesis
MLDILVFSHAAFRRVNRFIYNELSTKYSLNVKIVCPKYLQRGNKYLKADVPGENDVEVIFDNLIGTNPRTYKFENAKNILNEQKPKVIYLDNDPISFQALLYGKWAKRNNSYLICLTCENLSFNIKDSLNRLGAKGLITSLFKNTLLQLTRKNVSHTFVINKLGLEIFKNLGFKSVSLTPLGFDPRIFFPNPISRNKKRLELGINENTVVFSYIGRTVYEKGIHILLNSLSILESTNWIFIMDKFSATKTNYQEEIIEKIDNLGLKNKVKFFDASHIEISDYMNAADVVIVPSISTPKWKEQYGRVVPEAMGCAKYVVASNSGALPDILDKTGFLFEEGNEIELKNILDDLILNLSDYSNLKESARKRAHSKYTINVQSEILYNQIEILKSKQPN